MSDRVRSMRVPKAVVQAADDNQEFGLKVPDEATTKGSGEKIVYKWAETLKVINTQIKPKDNGNIQVVITTKVTPDSQYAKNRGRANTVWYETLPEATLADADLSIGKGLMSVITIGHCRQLIKACGFDPGPIDTFDLAEWFDAPEGEAKPLVGAEVLAKMENKVDSWKIKQNGGPNEDGSLPRRSEVTMWASCG